MIPIDKLFSISFPSETKMCPPRDLQNVTMKGLYREILIIKRISMNINKYIVSNT